MILALKIVREYGLGTKATLPPTAFAESKFFLCRLLFRIPRCKLVEIHIFPILFTSFYKTAWKSEYFVFFITSKSLSFDQFSVF